jgi:hypothetical protein
MTDDGRLGIAALVLQLVNQVTAGGSRAPASVTPIQSITQSSISGNTSARVESDDRRMTLSITGIVTGRRKGLGCTVAPTEFQNGLCRISGMRCALGEASTADYLQKTVLVVSALGVPVDRYQRMKNLNDRRARISPGTVYLPATNISSSSHDVESGWSDGAVSPEETSVRRTRAAPGSERMELRPVLPQSLRLLGALGELP